MPRKTKKKTVRKAKKTTQKQTANVNVIIDQSKRTRTVRREPKPQLQPQQLFSLKPSYGSSATSELAVLGLISKMLEKEYAKKLGPPLANQMSLPIRQWNPNDPEPRPSQTKPTNKK